MKKLAGPVAAAVGANMRAFRKNTTGEWIAREANELADLGWTKTTVSRIENGQRGLTAEELLLLPQILRIATGREITLTELIGDEVPIGKVVITRAEVEAEVRGDYESLWIREHEAIIARNQEELAEMRKQITGIAKPRKPPTKKGN